MPAEPKWYADSDNLALLLEWMHERGQPFDELMYALRKPWKYEREYLQARLELTVKP